MSGLNLLALMVLMVVANPMMYSICLITSSTVYVVIGREVDEGQETKGNEVSIN